MQKKEVKIIYGSTDILIIAPHGVQGKGVRKDDTNTDILAKVVAKELGCSAIINDSIKRSECDYNRISQATKDKRFITGIRKVLDADGPTLVVWIHGIGEKNKEKERAKMSLKGALDCVIGYGQPNRKSAWKETIDALSGLFRDRSITALPSADTGYLRAHEADNMNQWFHQQKEYDDQNKVQSVQFEFSMHLRESTTVENTARSISAVLSSLVRPLHLPVHKVGAEAGPDEKLVSKTYEYLKKVVQRHFHEAMLEAGEYIIKEFFAGNHELAMNPRNAVKIESLNQLIKRLQEDDGKAPSKTWVYDAVKLAVDEHYFAKINFRTYGKLGHSQKVYLTHVKNLEAKRELVLEAVENNYTVARTRERIAEVQGHDPHEKFSLDSVPTDADLEKAGRDDLIRLKKEALSKFEFHRDKMAHYQECLDAITKALKTIASKRGTPIGKVIELSPREAIGPEQQSQKREQGII